HEVLQLIGEDRGAVAVGEVALLTAPPRDRVDDPVDHLADTGLARRGAELAAEIFGGDDVRGGHRPERRDLDGLLFEDVPALTGYHRIAALPPDRVVRVDPVLGEEALEAEAVGLRLVVVLDRLRR